ncbi:hypothetical protein L3X38_011909 [Prunus dulcis]|uniref:Integrase catalytic domain-containing protein n=1 Tax=Prunus dulcis TaxID=3755 RepID=A0AAD4ZER4_PRUDU|nr:hypothetical protein L3X38_011909 [Prunus dulcis]
MGWAAVRSKLKKLSPVPEFRNQALRMLRKDNKALGNALVTFTNKNNGCVEALSSTKEADVERFIWRNIICRFGCPQSLVTDNGSQFISKQITTFFKKFGIKQHLSTPRYPQGNGQAEASNRIILDCLKKRLEDAEGKWVDELPGVLWAYRTTKRRSTGETPFSIAYETEAIIPCHVIVPSIGIEVGSIEQNSEQMRLNLDLLEGEREKAIVRVVSYQQRLKSYYDKRAKIR